jgi:putative copper export protein/mono/diheme cytochrome c family protein
MVVDPTLLAVARGLYLLALLLLLGTLVSLTVVVPSAARGGTEAIAATRRQLQYLGRAAAVAALLLGVAWLVMQAIAIGAPGNWNQTLAVLWKVIRDMRFGEMLVTRLALITLALVLVRGRRRAEVAALGLIAAAAALQGAVGHAGATGGIEGDSLFAAEALHLIAAGAWLGALPSLLLLIARLAPVDAAVAYRRFSPIGLGCVLLLIGTALAQATSLIGSVPALVGTPYGRIALIKLGLFLLLLILAGINHFILTPALTDAHGARTRQWMFISLSLETLLGALVVMTAAFLGSSIPAAHEQPNWPFPWRLSVTAMADPAARQAVILAVVMLGSALVAFLAAVVWRQIRWPAFTVAAILLWRAASHAALLIAPAYPTSYFSSPTDFATASIARGAGLYATNCAACHGATGYGDGPLAARLAVHPSDLATPDLWRQMDGDLFWWLSSGIDAPAGGIAMPGFADKLDPDARWALIDYIRARNAGATMAATGAWPLPLRAPSFPIDCAGMAAEELADLRGSVVYAASGSGMTTPPPSVNGVRIVMVRFDPGSGGAPAPGTCLAVTPSAWLAFAILAGTDPGALAGTAFLIDPAGWLRAVGRPNNPDGWHDPDRLRTAIRQIIANPVNAEEANAHAHNH